jgi:CRISPR-associated Cas5-like protein
MVHLKFELHGEYALWRHLGDALGAYSTPGPAPSHIAGILGAAMGMPNQASQRKTDNIAWNTSEELLTWERESEFRVGCRLLKSAVRVPYRVNGIKGVDEWVTLRMNQFGRTKQPRLRKRPFATPPEARIPNLPWDNSIFRVHQRTADHRRIRH